jgi:hypothetical protein
MYITIIPIRNNGHDSIPSLWQWRPRLVIGKYTAPLHAIPSRSFVDCSALLHTYEYQNTEENMTKHPI